MVNGIEKESYYIVAVATRKEYRGRRYMAGLLREALLDMYQAGVTFTYLMPAAEAIYLPHCTFYFIIPDYIDVGLKSTQL